MPPCRRLRPRTTTPTPRATTSTLSLGDVTNADGDPSTANREFAIVELNAIVLNVAGNQAGTTLDNTLETRLRGAAWSGPLSNTVTETVAVPSVSITKSASSPTADAADDVDFHLVVTNATGANVATALDTHVADAMPAGFTLDTGSVAVVLAGGAAGLTDASSGTALDLTLAQLPPGSTATVDYTATLSTTVAPASTLTNTALLTSTTLSGVVTGERDGSGGVNDLADSASAAVTINSSALGGTVYLDVDSSGTYNAGDSPTAGKSVTLTGTDHLGNAVSSVTTTDVDGEYVFDLLRPGTYAIDKAAAVLRADGLPAVGTQASGTAALRSISAIALPAGASTAGNGNDFPELIRSDLQVTKTGSPATVVAGDDVTFTITVTNQGPSPATGVTLNDPVPAALLVTGTTTDSGTCSTATNTVDCALGPMSVGATATVTVTATSTVEGTFTNTATADGRPDRREPRRQRRQRLHLRPAVRADEDDRLHLGSLDHGERRHRRRDRPLPLADRTLRQPGDDEPAAVGTAAGRNGVPRRRDRDGRARR